MGGVKTRRIGECVHRFWYEVGTDNKLTRILHVDNGKRSWIWGFREGDLYREVPNNKIVLR